MKIKLMSAGFAAAFLLLGCATGAKSKAEKNPNVQMYVADLVGDGGTQVIQTEDKTATDDICVVSVLNKNRNKVTQTLANFSVPGKITKLDFAELNLDKQKQIVLFFDGKDNISNIAIYQLSKNNKLTKIFGAASEFGIDTEPEPVMKVKIGKAAKHINSPNLLPDWDVWVWTGEKFVKQ